VVTASRTTARYTHLEPGKNVVFGIAGYYTPQQESRLEYSGREVLYIIGQVVLESACCNAGTDWVYTLVPGYIVKWQNTRNEEGLPVSEVEPVRDIKEKAGIRQAIQAREETVLIDFW
jgi:hypothetical protein